SSVILAIRVRSAGRHPHRPLSARGPFLRSPLCHCPEIRYPLENGRGSLPHRSPLPFRKRLFLLELQLSKKNAGELVWPLLNRRNVQGRRGLNEQHPREATNHRHQQFAQASQLAQGVKKSSVAQSPTPNRPDPAKRRAAQSRPDFLTPDPVYRPPKTF